MALLLLNLLNYTYFLTSQLSKQELADFWGHLAIRGCQAQRVIPDDPNAMLRECHGIDQLLLLPPLDWLSKYSHLSVRKLYQETDSQSQA